MSPRRKDERLEIGVLYGFRALMVLFVVNYHIWQQSWLGQYVILFGRVWSFDFWTRSSFLFVDGMILLSGFLLYLPYARQKTEGTSVPSVRRFYFNRLVRILPSYLFAILVTLCCIALPQRQYPSAGAAASDVAAHLTFTFLFWPRTYLHTPLNAALWTIGVEMQFYFLFPWLARAMQKRPLLTAGGMAVAAWLYRWCVATFVPEPGFYINQMPSFLDVYALGMLGAAAYCHLRLWLEKGGARPRTAVAVGAMALFAAGAYALAGILRFQSVSGSAGYAALQLCQLRVRLPLAVTLLAMMLSAAFFPRILQGLLDNRLMRFLSTISMNLYIWHQVLSVQMRASWFADTQLLHSDAGLQMGYTVLCVSVSILAAMAVTFGIEQPAARWARRMLHPRPAVAQKRL